MQPFILLVLALLAATSLGCDSRKSSERTSTPTNTQSVSTLANSSKVVELREQVFVIYQPDHPEYPAELKKAGIQGDIKLVLYLDKNGQIIRIEKQSGPDVFLPAAESYARRMRFDVDPACFPQMQSVPFRLTIKFQLPPKP